MSDNPYSPPSARIDEPVEYVETGPCPFQVRLAIGLAAFSYVAGLVVVAVEWDYFGRLQSLTAFALNQVLAIAFSIWLYYKIYRGRNWARIVLLVASLLGSLFWLSGTMRNFLAAMPMLAKVRLGFGLMMSGVILWLLFVSPGRRWFRRGTPKADVA